MPKSIPDYRNERKHSDFVANILIDPKSLKENIAEIFGISSQDNVVTDLEKIQMQRLIQNSQKIITS